MDHPVITIEHASWTLPAANAGWIRALEEGKVLYFPRLAFQMQDEEARLLRPEIRDPAVRNISLGVNQRLKGAKGTPEEVALLTAMMQRFRAHAEQLIHSLLPAYTQALQLAPTSFRPAEVADREQSLRANDRLLHVDSFPSRPNYGQRILRVFTNVNPEGRSRVWRIGEAFEDVADRFLPRARPYSPWQARLLNTLSVTKSLRSEYDHLMLQIHDAMKSDQDYQRNAPQFEMPFAAGSTWVCFSDQTSHAVVSGQYLLEQTLHLPPERQYDPSASPLAILTRMTGRTLV